MKNDITLLHGDCMEHLRNLPDNSVDSCVVDPPYHLTSVVKRFGKKNAAPAKHGTDGLFARASKGFMGKEWDGGDIAFRVELWSEVFRVLKPGAYLLSFAAPRNYHRMAVAIEDSGFEIRDQVMWMFGSGFPKSHNQGGDWEGWGTALKPAHEPICMARKPLVGTVAENLRKHAVGAINIDGCRIGVSEDDPIHDKNPHTVNKGSNTVYGKFRTDGSCPEYDPGAGRWPANVMHDGLPEEWARYFYCPKASKADREEGLDGFTAKKTGMSNAAQSQGEGYDKAQSIGLNRVKEKKNHHPTVKPTELMRYLCRLVTPRGGTVLDMFMGSGSTGKAAKAEGLGFIGIEKDREYFDIATARIGVEVDDLSDLFGDSTKRCVDTDLEELFG